MKQLLVSMFPSSIDTLQSFPAIHQCIGTKRLWSNLLGYSFWLDTEDEKVDCKKLQTIAFLSRSYLVIDDYMKDEYVTDHITDIGSKWLANIKQKIEMEITDIGGDPDEFGEQLTRCDSAFSEREMNKDHDLLRNAINKCEIFFNPYKLNSVTLNTDVRNKRIKYLDDFFTVCQLLDDFCDVEDDYYKKAKHNLFLNNIGDDLITAVICNKKALAPSVIFSALKLLECYSSSISCDKNAIIFFYHKISTYWLEWKMKQLSMLNKHEYYKLNCAPWIFNNDTVRKIIFKNSRYTVDTDIDDIRPEFMQTYFQGIRSIAEL